MKCNVGKTERIARVVIGLGLVAFAYIGQQPLAYIGIVPVLTGLFGYCPAYTIFNFSTACNKDDESCNK
jgi:hypothetical protein